MWQHQACLFNQNWQCHLDDFWHTMFGVSLYILMYGINSDENVQFHYHMVSVHRMSTMKCQCMSWMFRVMMYRTASVQKGTTFNSKIGTFLFVHPSSFEIRSRLSWSVVFHDFIINLFNSFYAFVSFFCYVKLMPSFLSLDFVSLFLSLWLTLSFCLLEKLWPLLPFCF